MLDERLETAIAAHRAGLLAVAEEGYRGVLAERAGNADAEHLLGLLLCDRGEPAAAGAHVAAALAREPHRAAFHNTEGRRRAALGETAAAVKSFEQAWKLQPDTFEIAHNLAVLLPAAEALDWWRRAAAMAPAELAVVLPFARCLLDNGAAAEAVAVLRGCQTPANAAALTTLGVALERLGRFEDAETCFEQAIGLDPSEADALHNLASLRSLDGRVTEARVLLEQAVAADPAHGAALWARCMVGLGPVTPDAAGVAAARAGFAAGMDALAARAEVPAAREALGRAFGAAQPFFLPAHGQNDRDLMAGYGALAARLFPRDAGVCLASRRVAGERLRVGFVSGHAREHTVWRLMLRGWLTHLDRAHFEVALFDSVAQPDAQTFEARRLAEYARHGTRGELRRAILEFRPHVLIHPEIGMDAVTAGLAAERLAPLQCTAWGQPCTSGLPTIDWFLSGDAMEPPEGQEHYTERLIRLPGLGVVPMMQAVPPLLDGRAALGARAGAALFWCGQPIWKYHPEYDELFVRIARRVADCQFLFIGFARSARATAEIAARIGGRLRAAGFDPDRLCLWVAPMEQAAFLASVAAADVVLDPPGWSGGKSTLDMLAVAPAMVTMPTRLMRGRHSAAILARLELDECIAADADSYVRLAARLARDPGARARISGRMAERRAALFADLSPVRELERRLLEAA